MNSLKAIALWLTASMLLIPTAEARQATGSLTGCITDTTAYPLPGVRVLIVNGNAHRQAVTDSDGCYNIIALQPGSYVALACLPGFDTVGHDGLTIKPERTETLDFQLHVQPICECIGYPSPAALWKDADAVVRVRLASQRLGPNPDISASVIHTAQIVTTWKSDSRVVGPTIAFRQDLGPECEPYEIGRELVLFLRWNAEHDAFERVNGGNGAFTLEQGRLTWAGVNDYNGKKVADFLAELDALAAK